MTKVNCRLKVHWKYFLQKILQFTLLIANHVLWINSIVANESQLELKKVKWILCSNWLSLATIEFTQSTWFAISKVNCNFFCRKSFQFTFSLQFTLVICTWSSPILHYFSIFRALFFSFSCSSSASKLKINNFLSTELEWSSWSHCTATCGKHGIQMRFLRCEDRHWKKQGCQHLKRPQKQIRSCLLKPCNHDQNSKWIPVVK